MHKVLAKGYNSWKPDRPVSRGATAYHDAVINATYYLENLHELANIVEKKIKENEIIVDFAAGTGVSALCLLKNLKVYFKLWLIDNSEAWLGKAHEILSNNSNVKFFLLDKINDRCATLAETIGEEIVDHVISANAIHLIPDLNDTFKGIYDALKLGGTFTFQSGNIMRDGRKNGVLMVDDTVKRVHDIALEIIQSNDKFAKYKKDINKVIEKYLNQRKFVFPDPKSVEVYLNMLKNAGFEYEEPQYKLIKISYKDWLDFLRVKRLQAGILPEIGGKEPSTEEEKDRDELITMASNKLFKELETQNTMADDECFTTEWIYVSATKIS